MISILKSSVIIPGLCAGVLAFASCTERDPASPPVTNEHDPPTTLIARFIAVDSTGNPVDTTTATVRDTTVVKGKPPVEGILTFKVNTLYLGEVFLLNETKQPPTDVTAEVDMDKEAHRFVWTPRNGIEGGRLQLQDFDRDGKGEVYGRTLRATVPPGPRASGTLNLVLRHYDSGDKSDPVYDTDVDRDFPVVIE